MSRLAACVLALALLIPAGLPAQEEAKKVRRNPDVITIEEIDAAGGEVKDGYDLVKRLRPLWMRRSRGEASVNMATPEVVVYVSGLRRGSLESLRDLPRGSVKEIQRMSGIDATQRFGPGHESGAILVTLR